MMMNTVHDDIVRYVVFKRDAHRKLFLHVRYGLYGNAIELYIVNVEFIAHNHRNNSAYYTILLCLIVQTADPSRTNLTIYVQNIENMLTQNTFVRVRGSRETILIM